MGSGGNVIFFFFFLEHGISRFVVKSCCDQQKDVVLDNPNKIITPVQVNTGGDY